MITSNDASNTPLPRIILTRLRRLAEDHEQTHDQVQRNGDGIKTLQVLIDLFQHPDKSVQELADLLGTTLEQMNRSAKLMADGTEDTRRQLATLSSMADRNEAVIAELLAEVQSMRAEQSAARAEWQTMRTELGRLRHDLGLDPIPTADDA